MIGRRGISRESINAAGNNHYEIDQIMCRMWLNIRLEDIIDHHFFQVSPVLTSILL